MAQARLPSSPSMASSSPSLSSQSASSSISQTPSGYPVQVAESCFHFMHLGMINYVKEQFRNGNSSNDGAKPGSGKKRPPHLEIINTPEPSESMMNAMFHKLELMGYGVGVRLCARFSKDAAVFPTNLDAVKFICKEFWILLFEKQMNKLQTNYKGVFMLYDNNFKWAGRLNGNEIDAKLYTAYISGIMRGALYSLGINATVKASLDMSMTSVPTPSCSFTVIDQDRIQSVVAQATASTPSVASMAQPNAQVR